MPYASRNPNPLEYSDCVNTGSSGRTFGEGEDVGTGFVHAFGTRLTKPPLTLVACVAAAFAFGLALLIGWATADTREDLARAQELQRAKPPPRLVVLGAASRLPPPPRRSARRPARPQSPRLIVGSG
jgi:hypothetical protein